MALLLGMGALSTAGAQANSPESRTDASLGDVLIRSEGGKIYLSEGGRDFYELQLMDTAEARYLRQLVEGRSKAQGTVQIRLNPTILAGGGGSGFYWWGTADKTTNTRKPQAANQADKLQKSEPAGKTNTTATRKKE